MTKFKKRLKDFQRCLKSIRSFTDGQAWIKDWDDDRLSFVDVVLQPNDGPYNGGQYVFKIIFPETYPDSMPNVVCTTPIYHPNIDHTSEEYNVCLNLFDEWNSSFGLEDTIQGLLFLMYSPNLEDPLSPYFDGADMDTGDFHENIKASLDGEVVEDFEYPRNRVETLNSKASGEQTKDAVESPDGSEAPQPTSHPEDEMSVEVILEKLEELQVSADEDEAYGLVLLSKDAPCLDSDASAETDDDSEVYDDEDEDDEEEDEDPDYLDTTTSSENSDDLSCDEPEDLTTSNTQTSTNRRRHALSTVFRTGLKAFSSTIAQQVFQPHTTLAILLGTHLLWSLVVRR